MNRRGRGREQDRVRERRGVCVQLCCLCSCLSYLSNLCKFPAYHAKHVELRLILLLLGNSLGNTLSLSHSLHLPLSICLSLPSCYSFCATSRCPLPRNVLKPRLIICINIYFCYRFLSAAFASFLSLFSLPPFWYLRCEI